MPEIFYQPVNRRAFLKSATLAGLGLAISGCQSAPKQAEAREFHVALLSDTHIAADSALVNRGFNMCDNLKRVVPEVMATRPSAVIVNGDAAKAEGLPADYVQFKSLLQPVAEVVPIYVTLGNHDDRTNFKSAIKPPLGISQDLKDKVVLVVERDFMRIIMLDSLLFTNKTPGLLGKNQRAWLAKYLAAHKDKNTIIFVHHTLTDNDGDLMDADRLFEVIRPHRQVKALFYGHSHVWDITQREKVRMINLPAIGYNFRDSDPVGWVDARFDPHGVDLTLHAFGGNRKDDGKQTRVEWI